MIIDAAIYNSSSPFNEGHHHLSETFASPGSPQRLAERHANHNHRRIPPHPHTSSSNCLAPFCRLTMRAQAQVLPLTPGVCSSASTIIAPAAAVALNLNPPPPSLRPQGPHLACHASHHGGYDRYLSPFVSPLLQFLFCCICCALLA